MVSHGRTRFSHLFIACQEHTMFSSTCTKLETHICGKNQVTVELLGKDAFMNSLGTDWYAY